MAKDLPDYMRGFDLDEDWGMTPVSSAPTQKAEPTIDKKDINSVQKVLKSNFLTQGPMVPKFEKKISKFVKNKIWVQRSLVKK